MPPTGARRRALRTVLSALAGGGLTAAALGGPLAPAVDGASFGSVPVVPEGTAGGGAAETGAEGPSSTTSTPAPTATTPATTPTTTPTSTTTTPQAAPPAAKEAPAVVLQRRQKTTAGQANGPNSNSTKETGREKATGPNNVAGSPQAIQAGALAAVLASSQASAQALAFYRVPLFLLPIYKAAAVQYGVPWQILAAINEIETDYGSDQSVSSAGAVGWMQFMPATWLMYGVDALNAGYADPYNPVDAIFAAARYLRAAGAATDMRSAILAYNHSEEYVNSVMLRAKLISTYPTPVIATLTGMIDGKLPVTGKQLQWGALPPEATPAASSATAGATASAASAGAPGAKSTPGSSAAPTPSAAAAHAPKSPAPQTVELTASPHATVVAVQDGRIMQIGESRRLGKFIVLRDVYGDLFTYAGLGSIAPSYTVAKPTRVESPAPGVQAAGKQDPTPSQPASAGTQAPVTLQVKTPAPQNHGTLGGKAVIPLSGEEAIPAGMGRTRLFAHPGNQDARAALAGQAARRARRISAGQRLPLRKGAVIAGGTVLGTVSFAAGAQSGHLRFAIRPAGDTGYIDPGPILANWAQLAKALHPAGAKATNALLGATAGDVFLLSKQDLERAVLSDPAITIYACGRQDIAAGSVDRRVLALLAFLSRSGLSPTVSALRCGQSQYAPSGGPSAAFRGESVDITAINGVPLAHHQGPGTITDLTIRALLTLPAEFVPQKISSLMHYPGQSSTVSDAGHWNHINIEFAPPAPQSALKAGSAAAHSAGKGTTAPAPVVTTSPLSSTQWSQLVTRIGSIPAPKVASKPTSAAIPDPKRG